MSHTTVYKISADWEIEEHIILENSYRWAFAIWTAVQAAYTPVSFMHDPDWWDVATSAIKAAGAANDLLVFQSTFDRMAIRRDRLRDVAAALREFAARHLQDLPHHLLTMADALEQAEQDGAQGVCIWTMSGTSDPWHDLDDDGEDVPYDFRSGTTHEWVGE